MQRRSFLAYTFFSICLITGLAGRAYAEPPNDESGHSSINVEAVITSVGEFDAFFCTESSLEGGLSYTIPTNSPLHQNAAPTATTDGIAGGTLQICYLDTHLWRPGFEAQITSDAFAANDAALNTPILATNFRITSTYPVAQTRTDAPDLDVGDIGPFGENGFVDPSGLPVPWTGAERSLDEARYVQFGASGAGTGGSVGSFDVELIIPAGTAPGTYSASVTLTIIPARSP